MRGSCFLDHGKRIKQYQKAWQLPLSPSLPSTCGILSECEPMWKGKKMNYLAYSKVPEQCAVMYNKTIWLKSIYFIHVCASFNLNLKENPNGIICVKTVLFLFYCQYPVTVRFDDTEDRHFNHLVILMQVSPYLTSKTPVVSTKIGALGRLCFKKKALLKRPPSPNKWDCGRREHTNTWSGVSWSVVIWVSLRPLCLLSVSLLYERVQSFVPSIMKVVVSV